MYDVIIIGGGPAGLNAAVVLGRCLRKVLILDSGKPRNQHSQGTHNYLTRDHIQPSDFLSLSRKEVKKYGVNLIRTEAVDAKKTATGQFIITDAGGKIYQSKILLLATGLKDILPPIEGLEELYGRSVFHCPYCDAWEIRNKKIGLYAKNKNGLELALSLHTWSPHITYFTDGRNYLKEDDIATLEKFQIPLFRSRVKKLHARKGKLISLLLESGEAIPCDALFIVNGYTQQSSLAERLGCTMNRKRVVITNRLQQTNIPGLYVAGDASRDMQFVVVAAAEGAKAGVTINKVFQKEEKEKILGVKK